MFLSVRLGLFWLDYLLPGYNMNLRSVSQLFRLSFYALHDYFKTKLRKQFHCSSSELSPL